MKALFLVPLAWIWASSLALGIINYGVDNSVTTVHPELLLGPGAASVPWDIVGRVSREDGTGTSGSAVYLGDRFVLTANHVSLNNARGVYFEGEGFFARDTGLDPVRIGTTDMKIFKLADTPAVAAAKLYTGESNSTSMGFHVAWG